MGPDKVEKLLQRAQLAIAERDWDKAKQMYLMALMVRGDLPDVHYGLATVYFQLKELTSAAHHFREVTRIDPLRAGAYINLGAVLNVLEQFDEALTALRRGIQLDPKRVEGYYNLGLVYRRKGQLDLAIQSYREAIRLNPRMADAHLNLGNLFMEREQPRQALQHYEAAVQIRPGWEKAHEGLESAKLALDPQAQASGSASVVRAAPAVGGDMDRMVDPVTHGAFLTSVHQASIVIEETGRLLHTIVLEEIEPVIKELSSALLQRGSRGELETCITKFENALGRMKTTHQALKGQVNKVEEMGERFPTH